MEIDEGHISKGIVDIRIPCKYNLPRGIYEFACQRIAVNESFCGDVSFFTTNMIKWLTVLLIEPIWIAVLQKKCVTSTNSWMKRRVIFFHLTRRLFMVITSKINFSKALLSKASNRLFTSRKSLLTLLMPAGSQSKDFEMLSEA